MPDLSKINKITPEERDANRIAAGLPLGGGADASPGKGHVPLENLPRYRRIAGIADRFRSLAGAVSGYGEYGDANLCWELEKKYRDKANELRADLPQPIPKEENQ